MNVLLVSEPGVDGVFRYVEALAHHLIGEGVTVHLAYSDRRGSVALTRLVEHVRIHGGDTLNLATANRPALTDLRALLRLRALVSRVAPDVIHSHSSKAGVLARLLPVDRKRVLQLYQPHAYAGMQPGSRFLRYFYNGVERWLGRRGFTINCSIDEQTFARTGLGLGPARLIHVPNGVDTKHFRPPSAEQKQASRRVLGLPEGRPVLGAMARTAQQKDPMTLYRALVEAFRREPNFVLYHVGRGELDEVVLAFIRSHNLGARVIRRDHLSNPVEFYRAVDGLILTSLYEGMSLAVLEALACDLPLILSDAPGNREFINLPLSHLQVAQVGNPTAFADAIVRWAAAMHTTPRPSNHRAFAVRRFDSRTTFTRLLNLYRGLSGLSWPVMVTLPSLASRAVGRRRNPPALSGSRG